MKRDWNHLDLSTAFHPIPEACSQALMEAARSAVQKKRPKRVPYRIVFAAALVLLCTAAMAYVITQQGWAEFLGQQFGISISPSAKEALYLHAMQSFYFLHFACWGPSPQSPIMQSKLCGCEVCLWHPPFGLTFESRKAALYLSASTDIDRYRAALYQPVLAEQWSCS